MRAIIFSEIRQKQSILKREKGGQNIDPIDDDEDNDDDDADDADLQFMSFFK